MVLTGGWGKQEGWDPSEPGCKGLLERRKGSGREGTGQGSSQPWPFGLSLSQLSFSSEHPPDGTIYPPVTYTVLLVAHIDVWGVSTGVVARPVWSKDKLRFVLMCNSVNKMSYAFGMHKHFPYCEKGQEVLRNDLWCYLECKCLVRGFLVAGAVR